MAQANKITLEIYQLIVQSITSSNHLDDMADKLTQLLVGALGIKGAAIYILDPIQEELELLASTGLSFDYINKGPILVDRSIKIGSNREPVIIQDTASSDLLQYPEKAQQEGVRAIVSYPITVRNNIIGSLRLYHSETWPISEDDIRFVAVLAQTAGLALLCFRLANAVHHVKDTMDDIHAVWL